MSFVWNHLSQRIIFGIVLLVSMASAPAGTKSRPIIAASGKAYAQIVITDQPPRAVKLAASELQKYVKAITGAMLAIVHEPTSGVPIKIYVGESNATRALGVSGGGLPYGGYRIVSGNHWLALVGYDRDFVPVEPWARSHGDWLHRAQKAWDQITPPAHYWGNPMVSRLYKHYNKELDLWRFDDRGSLNAVYGFLRDLGVRWYMPGKLGEFLPDTHVVELPDVNRTVRPDMKIRFQSWPRFAGAPQADVLWALRLGLNARPFDALMPGHGVSAILEREEQGRAHPELYRMSKDKLSGAGEGAQPYLSSEAVFRETVTYALFMFKHYPDLKTLSIMPPDGFSKIDQRDQDKATPDRGPEGIYSDYVWDFVNRVAREVAKTYPDRKIVCCAYSTYRLPPLKIAKLPPNVMVTIVNGRPRTDGSDEAFKQAQVLRRAWMNKTTNPLSIWLNYPFTQGGVYRPQYFPHFIGRGIQADVKDQVWCEEAWFPEQSGLYQPGMNSLNVWMTARLWWQADQDADALLEDYCARMYGPAAKQMLAFICYSEANYAKIGEDQAITDRDLALFDQAKAASDPASAYGQRIALVDPWLKTLRNRAVQLAQMQKRGKVREFSKLMDMKNPGRATARGTLVMDGKLDEPFWTTYPYGATLMEPGVRRKPKYPTTFYARWWKNELYLGIRCNFNPADPPALGTKKADDPAILTGEHIEVLLQTDEHSYYQIAVNPAGAMIGRDRGASSAAEAAWHSQAQAATYVGPDFWSAEVRIPVSPGGTDPLHTVRGHRPTADLPWYFNIIRMSAPSTGGKPMITAFSPTDNLHDPMKFGKLWSR